MWQLEVASRVEDLRIRPAGDAAVMIDLGDRIDLAINRRVHAVAAQLNQALSAAGPIEVIPGYVSVLVSYDPRRLTYEVVVEAVRQVVETGRPATERPALPQFDAATSSEQAGTGGVVEGETVRRFVLPVSYGGEYGPDLEDVARFHAVPPEEIVRRHAHRDYPIFCLGFSPGFPLLGGLPESLRTPRLESPRPRVPAGSVAIGGEQTGVYPRETPGGWRLIGRTPLVLFDIRRDPPVAYRPGDVIRFEPINLAEYERLRESPQMPVGAGFVRPAIPPLDAAP